MKNQNDIVFLIPFLAILNSFLCFEIMVLFDLISSFNNTDWYCLHVFECLKLPFASLKIMNLDINISRSHICENSKSASFFQILKSSLWNLRRGLTTSTPYLLRIIFAIDLFAGNLGFNKNENTSARTIYNHFYCGTSYAGSCIAAVQIL